MSRHQYNEYLPSGEVLYRLYWVEMGTARSHSTLLNWCKKEGYRNPNTGKPPSPMAPWFRMWRWALHKENFKLAYEMYNLSRLDFGEFYSEEDFKKYLDDKALTVFKNNPRKYREYQEGKY